MSKVYGEGVWKASQQSKDKNEHRGQYMGRDGHDHALLLRELTTSNQPDGQERKGMINNSPSMSRKYGGWSL